MSFAGKIGSLFNRRSDQKAINDRPPADLEGLTAYLVTHLKRKAKMPSGTIVTSASVISEMGMDSLTMVRLSKELEDMLGVSIEPALVFEADTIRALAEVLHGVRLENQMQQT